MKRPAEVTDFLCCGGVNCDGNCNSGRNVEECLTWRVHGYIEQLESLVPRWIPVEERMPEDGKNVLIFVRTMSMWWHMEVDWHTGNSWHNNAETDWNKITHWMPLPEPPKEAQP